MILCFHSSPNPDGNLARMVHSVAQAGGLEYEIVRLAEMDIAPCTEDSIRLFHDLRPEPTPAALVRLRGVRTERCKSSSCSRSPACI
jgi:hypothetical protein